jgi:hypothetical protein
MASKITVNTRRGAAKATAPIKSTISPKSRAAAYQSKSGVGPTTPENAVTYKPSQGNALSPLPLARNKEKEMKLVEYLKARLHMADSERQNRIQRCVDIDVALSGFVKLDADDNKRDRDNKKGKAPKPTKHNIPLAAAQIDEAVTFHMQVFAPEMDIFTASSTVNKQPLANGLTQEVNNQGQRAQYYRHFSRMIANALKYNFGGFTCMWEKHYGYVFTSSGAGQVNKEPGVVWEGNMLKSINAYNFFYDTNVHPVDLAMRGEFFAEAELVSGFRALKMQNDNLLFGIERCFDKEGKVKNDGEFKWYREPPAVRNYENSASSGRVNFQADLQAGAGSLKAPAAGGKIELVNFTCWIVPKEFGLSTSDELELWRVTLAQNKYICYGAKLDDTHGMLPCGLTTPLEDDLGNEQRTYAEQLTGLQHYASFLLNVDQDAARKSLYGITVYNPAVFPGLDKRQEELVGANIPMRSTNSEIDIDKVFRHYATAPNTDRNWDKMKGVVDLMQKVLPTDQLRQVADLERATLYQAAATVQASNRRNLKTARMIYDQCLMYIKLQMIYNILSNMSEIEYVDEETGEIVKISPAALVEAKLELDVGTGIKGIDKLMQLQIWERILNAIIQSQAALQEFDIVKFLTFFASMAGDKTDLAQFRRTTPPTMGPDGKPIAGPTAVPGAAGNKVGGLGAA